MSGWFEAQIVATGRLPLFCFFVMFLSGFGLVRLSARLIRAQVRWWPRNVMAGTVHVHHMVFGVVFMVIGGVAELAAPLHSLALRTVGAAPVGVKSVTDYQLPGSPGAAVTLTLTVALLFVLATITLLKGKIWTGLFGLFVPPLFIVGAIRLARPGSPWARWRYRERARKLARARRREQRLRQPVIRAKIWLQDL